MHLSVEHQVVGDGRLIVNTVVETGDSAPLSERGRDPGPRQSPSDLAATRAEVSAGPNAVRRN